MNSSKPAAPLFLLGTHYGVVKTLLTNPSQYAERVVGTASDVSTFKKNPTIPGMQRFLTGQCSSQEPRTTNTYVNARGEIWQASSRMIPTTRGHPQAGHNPANRGRGRRHRRQVGPPIDSDDDDPENPPPPRPQRSERKRKHGGESEELVLSDDDKGKGKGKSKKKKKPEKNL